MKNNETRSRDTVGKISSDLLNKTPYSNDPIEIERAMHEDYVKNVTACVETAKKNFFGDFFVIDLEAEFIQNIFEVGVVFVAEV